MNGRCENDEARRYEGRDNPSHLRFLLLNEHIWLRARLLTRAIAAG
jgi:hypothetical protein